MQLKHTSWSIASPLRVAIVALSASAAFAAPPKSAGDLFTTTKVWTVHLEFTPAEWARIEPKGGQQGPGGPGGMRGPGGQRGGMFGPGMMGAMPGGLGGLLSPSFMKGDANGDGRLSQEEFAALGRAWFTAWDKSASGKLSAEQLRDGLNAAFPPPAMFGGSGQGPGGPGGQGPGGPGGGRGPGGPSFNGANGRNGLSAAMGIDFEYVNATVDFDGARLTNIAARYKGNATFMQSRGTVKRPFKLDLSEYVKGQKLAGQSKINLHNGVTDASWMNEVLSYRAFRDAGVPSPRTSYAKLFVTVPGTHDRRYFGLYSIVEEVDGAFVQDRYASKDGAIFKPSTRQLFEYQGDDWAKYNQQYDPKTKLTPAQIERVISFSKLVSNASDEEFRKAAAQYVDLDEFARFMAVNVWLTNLDSILGMGQNFYVYLNAKTNKFEFLPWDLDHSFGQFPMGGSQEQREKLSIDRPWNGQVKLLERMFAVPEFRDKYRARLAEYQKSIFNPARIGAQVDEIAAAIRPAVGEESADKLKRFDAVVRGESVAPAMMGFGGPGPGGAGGGPRPEGPNVMFGPGNGPGGPGGGFVMRGPGGPGGFGAMKPIKGFMPARYESVSAQLAGKESGEVRAGGPGGGPGRGPGGMPGPAMFLQRGFMTAMDADKDGVISRDEFAKAFDGWFAKWSGGAAVLTEEQLRAGLGRDLMPMPAGPPML